MSKLWVEFLDISGTPNAGSAGTAIISVPGGFRVHDVKLELTSGAGLQIADGFQDVTVLRNGRQQRAHTVTVLDEVNSFFNARFGAKNDTPGGTGILPIFFSEWFRKSYGAAEFASWDIAARETLQIKVGVLAAATAPNVKAWGLVEAEGSIANFNPAREITKQFTNSFPVQGSVVDINNIARQDRLGLLRLSDPTGATITEVAIKRDGEEIFKRTKTRNDAELAFFEMNPVVGHFDIVPDITDLPLDLWNLNGVGKFEVHVTLSGAGSGNIDVITQTVGPAN